ncbi:23S rRNA (pseudouridine(1915)-N(3))-methyltransferase RlmH [Robiginitalea sediminis]|uniref:23S rRNA (pseudouridine(1915)-N(3))-methyltransferase RlmH n=1 Tax=Robiginitalea sediminis TaxID=1982593 RepID=UPI000B4B9B02|nr:23S rRNA (pseudouridine(1915)-N(3))-methyltransferase RlmH [Robiginitalea sediminis]
MKLVLLAVGPTDKGALSDLVADFSQRISRYIPFEIKCIPDIRNRGQADPQALKQKEAEQLLKHLDERDMILLLDETGKTFTSRQFAAYLQKCMNAGPKRVVLVIGGAYGIGEPLRQRAAGSVSLSKMTFNHQVVRLMAVEQLYRGLSILRGDPYHND